MSSAHVMTIGSTADAVASVSLIVVETLASDLHIVPVTDDRRASAAEPATTRTSRRRRSSPRCRTDRRSDRAQLKPARPERRVDNGIT
jgi:hypothetical protein